MKKIYVLGIGFKPFHKDAEEKIYKSDVILASERIFDLFKETDIYNKVKDKVKIINNVDDTFEFIKTNSNILHNIIILASGDPLFYGIGRRAIKELGKDSVEIIPDLSSIQIAFSKIKESWEDAFLMSLHGGPDPSKRRHLPFEIDDLPQLIKIHKKILILTDKQNNPTKIAQTLLESGSLSHFHTTALKMYVCEKLGYPDEKIIEGLPSDIAKGEYEHPNLVIIINNALTKTPTISKSDENIVFGLSEGEITHTEGLITKDEIRAISLHKLKLPERGVFWDIGAGSGSISIEASRLSPLLKIYAIERDKRQIQNILDNKKKFSLCNVNLIEGEAPDVFESLPDPQRVFIGGSGGKIEEIIQAVCLKEVDVIVINAATMETLNKGITSLQRFGYDVDVSQVSVSRMKKIGEGNYFSSLNPIFIVKGTKRLLTKIDQLINQ